MSRAFVKEDAAREDVVVPQRAPLPPGVPNYVTPRGMELLRAELRELTAERDRLQAGGGEGAERSRRVATLQARIDDLRPRIASAEVVEPADAPRGAVAFGATVTIRTLSGRFAGEESRLAIVGVDEAEASEGRIAFTAPIARALQGLRVGETATLKVGARKQELEVLGVDYPES